MIASWCLACSENNGFADKVKKWAVVVAQLVERLLVTPEVGGRIQSSANFC